MCNLLLEIQANFELILFQSGNQGTQFRIKEGRERNREGSGWRDDRRRPLDWWHKENLKHQTPRHSCLRASVMSSRYQGILSICDRILRPSTIL